MWGRPQACNGLSGRLWLRIGWLRGRWRHTRVPQFWDKRKNWPKHPACKLQWLSPLGKLEYKLAKEAGG